MITVLLQLTNRALKLTPVKRSGKQNLFGIPAEFDLPEALKGGRAMENIPALAAFTGNRIQGTQFMNKPYIFCLDDDHVITKEFKHLEAKPSDLEKLARVEAETVLTDDVKNYIVIPDGYRRPDPATGRLKSILYAAPAPLVKSIAEEFKKRGMKVEKIMPPISGLLYSCKKSLGLYPQSWLYMGKTVAFLDVGPEKLRMLLYSNGVPVFQKDFESVYPDILEALHTGAAVSYEEAAKEIRREGFLLTAGAGRFGDETAGSVRMLIDTAVNEVMRNLRVVLSSERLELTGVIFSGMICYHPDFERFVERLSLGVECTGVESACSSQMLDVAVDPQTAVAGLHPADFFALNGLLTAQKSDCINFLCEENAKRENRQINFLIMAVVTLAAAAAMALEPMIYAGANLQHATDLRQLASPQFLDVQKQLSRQQELKAQLRQLEAQRGALPDGKSGSQKILAQVEAQVAPMASDIKSCTIDNTAGTVSLELTLPSLDALNSLENKLTQTGYFTVTLPISVSRGETGGYQCVLTLKVNNFRPYAVSSQTSGGKAAQSK